MSAAITGGATIRENATAGLEELRDSKKGGEKKAMNMRTFRKSKEDPKRRRKTMKAGKHKKDFSDSEKKKGKTRREAVQQMTGLKSIRKLVQTKFQKERRA